MLPGKEMDAIIAEKIMDWTDVELNRGSPLWPMTLVGSRPGEEPSPYTGHKQKYNIPEYSTDIKAAWQVVEKMYELDREFQIELFKSANHKKIYRVSFSIGKHEEICVSTSAPHAIGHAALQACGVEL